MLPVMRWATLLLNSIQTLLCMPFLVILYTLGWPCLMCLFYCRHIRFNANIHKQRRLRVKREEDLAIGTLRGGDSRRARKGRRRDEMAMELENIVANTVLVKAREGRALCSL